MNTIDVAVIGGGPAGYSAALAAAAEGARVVLAESDRLGGTCVNWSCIPTTSMVSSAVAAIRARELAFLGIVDGDADCFHLSRAAARKDAVVRQLGAGVGHALRAAGVEVLSGRAELADGCVAVHLENGTVDRRRADRVVVAAGARWELPAIGGLPEARVLSADAVQALAQPPSSALVVGGASTASSFALEYAVLLAVAGTAVRLAVPGATAVTALDADLDPFVTAGLDALGIELARFADLDDAHLGDGVEIGAVIDRRVPAGTGIGLEAAGVVVRDGRIIVDADGRTSAADVFGAGDVTGGAMTSAAALEAGRVAGAVAAGGRADPSPGPLATVIHAIPEVAWIGPTEEDARAGGRPVAVGACDLAHEPHAVIAGGGDGAVKLIADATSGEVLSCHVVGAGAAEVVAVVGLAIGAELTVEDLARLTPWHPTASESVRRAARSLL